MKWEYKTVRVDLTDMVKDHDDDRLKSIGWDDWELVAVVNIADSFLLYFFKKAVNVPFDRQGPRKLPTEGGIF